MTTATETVAHPRNPAPTSQSVIVMRWVLRLLLLASAVTLFFLDPRQADLAMVAGITLVASFGLRLGMEAILLVGRRTGLGSFLNMAWAHNVLLGLLYPVWHKLLVETAFSRVLTTDWVREVLVIYLLISLALTILLHLHHFLHGRWNTLCSTLIIFVHSVIWLVLRKGLVAFALIVVPYWFVAKYEHSIPNAGWLLIGYYALLTAYGLICLFSSTRAVAVAREANGAGGANGHGHGNGNSLPDPAWARLHKSPLGLISVALALIWLIPNLFVIPFRRLHERNQIALDTAGIRSMAGNRTLLDWYTLLLVATGLVAMSTPNFLNATTNWRPFLPTMVPAWLLSNIARYSALTFLIIAFLALLLIGWLFLKRHFTTVVALRLVVRRALSYIAIVTVALGVFVLVVVTAVMGGFKQELRKRVRGSLSHMFMYLPVPEVRALASKYALGNGEGTPEDLARLDDHYQLYHRAIGGNPDADLRAEVARLGAKLQIDLSDDPGISTQIVRVITAQMLDRVPPGAGFETAIRIALRTRLNLPVPQPDTLALDQVAMQAKAKLIGCPDWETATTPDAFISSLRRQTLMEEIDKRRQLALKLNDPQFRARLRQDIQWAYGEDLTFVAPVAGQVETIYVPPYAQVAAGTRVMDITRAGGQRVPVFADRAMLVRELHIIRGQDVRAGDPLMTVDPPRDLRGPMERRALADALRALDAIGPNATDVIAGAAGRVRTMALIVRRHERDIDYCNLIGIDAVHDLTVSDIGAHLEQALYKEMDQALRSALKDRLLQVAREFGRRDLPEATNDSPRRRTISPDQLTDIGRQLFEQIDITEKLISKLPPRDPGPAYELRETELLRECKQRLEAVIELRLNEIIDFFAVRDQTTHEQAADDFQNMAETVSKAVRILTRGIRLEQVADFTPVTLLNTFPATGDDQKLAAEAIGKLTDQEWEKIVTYYQLRRFRGSMISGVVDLHDWLRRYFQAEDRANLFEGAVPSLSMPFQPDELSASITVLPDAGGDSVLARTRTIVHDALTLGGTPGLTYDQRLNALITARTSINAALRDYITNQWPTLREQLRRGSVTPAEHWQKIADNSLTDYRFSEHDIAAIDDGLVTLLSWATGFDRQPPVSTFFERPATRFDCIDRLVDRDLQRVRKLLYDQVAGTGPFIGVTLVPNADGNIVVDRIASDAGAAGSMLVVGDRFVSLNGTPVPDFGVFRKLCEGLQPGVTATLIVERLEGRRLATATLQVPIELVFNPGVRQIVPFDRVLRERARDIAEWGEDHGEGEGNDSEGNGEGEDGPQTQGTQTRPNIADLDLDQRIAELAREMPPAIVGDKLAEHYGIGEALRPGWRTRIHLATAVPSDGAPTDSGGGVKDEFVAREQGFHIAGTFHSRLYEDDRRRLYIPIEDALRFVDGSRTAVTVAVKLAGNRYEQTSLYLALLSCAAAQNHSTRAAGRYTGDLAPLPNFLTYVNVPEPIRSWEQERESLLQAVDREEMILTIVLSMIILYAGIMIVIIIYLMVKEKTKDIGVLKALGGSPDGIQSIFLFNGLFIGVFGALLGLAMGLTVAFQSNWIEDTIERIWGVRIFPAEIYYLSYIPMKTDDPMLWVMICVPTILLAFLFALYPASKAARMDPVESLQYE